MAAETSTTTLTQAEVKLEPVQPAPPATSTVAAPPVEALEPKRVPPPPAPTGQGSLTIISGSGYEQNMGIADGGPNAAPPQTQAPMQPAPPQTYFYETAPAQPEPTRRPGPASAADRNTWAGDSIVR